MTLNLTSVRVVSSCLYNTSTPLLARWAGNTYRHVQARTYATNKGFDPKEVCRALLDKPVVGEGAWIAPGAQVMGRVTFGDDASVFYNCTLRADINHITIGARSNIQDNTVIHVNSNRGTQVGNGVTVGHSALLHACTVGDNVLIGMAAVVMDGAEIGRDSIVAARALVPKDKVFPERSVIVGSPAKVVRKVTDEEVVWLQAQANKYVAVKDAHVDFHKRKE